MCLSIIIPKLCLAHVHHLTLSTVTLTSIYESFADSGDESEIFGDVTGPAGDLLTKECSQQHDGREWNKECML